MRVGKFLFFCICIKESPPSVSWDVKFVTTESETEEGEQKV